MQDHFCEWLPSVHMCFLTSPPASCSSSVIRRRPLPGIILAAIFTSSSTTAPGRTAVMHSSWRSTTDVQGRDTSASTTSLCGHVSRVYDVPIINPSSLRRTRTSTAIPSASCNTRVRTPGWSSWKPSYSWTREHVWYERTTTQAGTCLHPSPHRSPMIDLVVVDQEGEGRANACERDRMGIRPSHRC